MRSAVFVTAALLAVCVGCVDSSFPEGLLCEGPDQRCPPGQHCFATGGEMKCFAAPPADGAIDGPLDAALDASAIDATPDATPGECNPVLQDCTAPLACYWRSAGAGGPYCATAGAMGPHAPCSLDTQCLAGFGCGPTPFGNECAPYCAVTNPMCGASLDQCTALDAAVGQCIFGGCDPLVQNCAPTEGCYYDPMPDLGVCTMTPGTLPQGAVCAAPFDCAPGYHCLSCGAVSKCARYCNVVDDCMDLATTCALVADDLGACTACP